MARYDAGPGASRCSASSRPTSAVTPRPLMPRYRRSRPGDARSRRCEDVAQTLDPAALSPGVTIDAVLDAALRPRRAAHQLCASLHAPPTARTPHNTTVSASAERAIHASRWWETPNAHTRMRNRLYICLIHSHRRVPGRRSTWPVGPEGACRHDASVRRTRVPDRAGGGQTAEVNATGGSAATPDTKKPTPGLAADGWALWKLC